MSLRIACAALVAAAATVIAVRPASACGAGGGLSGLSFAGGGDEVKKCETATEIVGRRTCGRFGSWRRRHQAHVLEVITTTTYLDLDDLESNGTISHGAVRYSYRIVGDDLGADDGPAVAAGIAIRYVVHGPLMYVGTELGLAAVGGDESDSRIDPASGAELRPRVESAATAAAVLGARTFVSSPFGRDAPLSLSAEAVAGVRVISVVAHSSHGSCVVDDTVEHTRPMVEARARADVWLTPRLTVGAYAGGDVITHAPTAGFVFSAHLRAFDGGR